MEPSCRQCPRSCNTVRNAETVGFCGVPDTFRVARIARHHWEEPSVSGTRGSGTVFFSGCNLRCVFCQNRELSHDSLGTQMSDGELEDAILRLQDEGAHNINLVTPTHYADRLSKLLQNIKPKLHIPVLYNSGGYESVEMLKRLEGLVDIYLPDFKYLDAERARAYSKAADYPTVALTALKEMLRQVGACKFDEDGLLLRGVVVRHLVLPGGRKDSIALLRMLAQTFGSDAFLLSLMSQYTPDFAKDAPFPELHRRVTAFEYDSVLREAEKLGFDGYFQARSSATSAFTPDFHEKTF